MSEYFAQVPDSWWRVACEHQHHPLACVTAADKFYWCNQAWERLTGYSQRELESKTWMDITVAEDVGGDMQSADEIREGKKLRYSMTKRYIHKLGHVIEIEMTVFRFPQLPDIPFECFIVEALPCIAFKKDMAEMSQSFARENDRLAAELLAVTQRMDRIETVKNENKNRSANTITIGGSTDTRWIVTIVLALLGVIGYLIYIGGWSLHGGKADPPPVIESPE